MYTIYRVNADDLDQRLLDSLKMIFKHKRIEIAVSEVDDAGEAETAYLLKSEANRLRLMDAVANIESNTRLVYISSQDLENLP